MKISDSHDVEHFILFLENRDGKNWNALMSNLCKIYADSQEQNFNYYPDAVCLTTSFVWHWYSEFWSKYAVDKQAFVRDRPEITAFVATQIACDALEEFKLGNLF